MSEIEQNYLGQETKPAICCVAITKGCMFQCKMCYIWKRNKSERLVTEVDVKYWERFLNLFKDFVEDPLNINFVGGESLTSDATLGLIKYASNLGYETVLTSNAYLINTDMAKKIADSGLNEIYLSLDSLKAETHDFLRGVNGSFQRVINAIGYLNKYAGKVPIIINAVITEINLEEIIDLTRWVMEDSRIASVRLLAVTQPFDTMPEDNWYEKNEYGFLWPKEPEKTVRIMDGLIKLKEENVHKILNPAAQLEVYKLYFNNPRNYFKQEGCHIYKRILNVSSNGQINMCFDMDPIGNIKQDGFNMQELWDSLLAVQVRESIRNCKKNCHLRVNCYFDK